MREELTVEELAEAHPAKQYAKLDHASCYVICYSHSPEFCDAAELAALKAKNKEPEQFWHCVLFRGFDAGENQVIG